MDARAALVAGGGAAVAVTVAVASVIGITSAAALADRAGTPLADAAIVVPGHTLPTAAASTAGETRTGPVTVPAPDAQEISEQPAQRPVARPSASAARNATGGSSTPSQTGRRAGSAGDDARRGGQSGNGRGQNDQGQNDQGQNDQGARKGQIGQSADDNAQDLLRRAQQWRSEMSVQLRRASRQLQDSARKAVETSDQVHPRTWDGWQKQSSRSPDSGD